MSWILFILSLVALIVLHLWWRRRFSLREQSFRRKTEELASAHQKEIAVRDSQEKALLDSMVEGLLVLDAHSRIRLASRAFSTMFGITSDVRGKTLLEAIRLHELDRLAETLDSNHKQIDGHELKLTDDRWVGVSGGALFAPDGTLSGKLLVFHDLTRIKRLERTRQEFVANVSHELRTPLSMIKGYAETLLDGARDNPEVAVRFLQTIDRNAERLRLLIEDLLTISELESNRITLNLKPVEARSLTAKVVEDFASRANTRQIRLINSVPDLAVTADAARLEQVLVNLVDNAIKYGREGGTVEVSAQASVTDWIQFSVSDDGPGISAEALGRIFERFYREDKARSRERGGTGLGLAIVKHIIQSHGGKVWAQSTLGQGATFCFSLPGAPRP